MGKIKDFSREKAEQLQATLRVQAQQKFLQDVMKWEEVDYPMALAICEGRTVEKEWEYTLGYKMCDPLMQLAMNGQLRGKHRAEAVETFKTKLCPEELEIFEREVEPMKTREMFKAAMKKEKKRKG